jgi:hypothetical protein
MHARRQGLITLTKKQQWECDGVLLLRLLKKQARTGPLPLNGAALAGIGEMLACTHIEKLAAEKATIPVIKRLSKIPSAWRKRLKEAVITSTAKNSEKPLEGANTYSLPIKNLSDWKDNQLALTQGKRCSWNPLRRQYAPGFLSRLRHSRLSGSNTFSVPVSDFNDWKESRLAFSLAERCSGDFARREYALGFLSRLILIDRPEEMARFADEVALYVPINTIAGEVAKLSGFYPRLADAAMRTGVPVLVMTGAFSLGTEFSWRPKMPLSLIVSRLEALRIPSEGKMRICMQLLNESRIATRRSNQKIADTLIKIRELAYRPHITAYRPSDVPGVLAREQKNLDEWQQIRLQAEEDFTLALKVTAGVIDNPQKGWGILESISLHDAEYICRFALAHEGQKRNFMLSKALSTFVKRLTSQESWPFINDDNSSYWFAKAQTELSFDTQDDAGAAAGRRIGGSERVLRESVQAPFAAIRHEHFTSDLKRWAKLLDFAFHVSLSFKTIHIKLIEHALHSARAFFPIASRSLLDDVKLIADVAAHSATALLEFPEDKAREWMQDPLLPDAVKAYVIWSHRALLEDMQQTACELAENLLQSCSGEPEGIDALTWLIDQALIAHAGAPVSDSVKTGLTWLWEQLPDSGDYAFVKLLSTDILLAALAGDDLAKEQVKNDHFWGYSRIGVAIT